MDTSGNRREPQRHLPRIEPVPFHRGSYALTQPPWPVFAIASVRAILRALIRYEVVAIPALSRCSFEMALVAVLLLIAGALRRGI